MLSCDVRRYFGALLNLMKTVGSVWKFNFTLVPSPVPLYSFDWLAMWQKKEELGETALRLAFARRSVTPDGWLGMGNKMVQGVDESEQGVGAGFTFGGIQVQVLKLNGYLRFKHKVWTCQKWNDNGESWREGDADKKTWQKGEGEHEEDVGGNGEMEVENKEMKRQHLVHDTQWIMQTNDWWERRGHFELQHY